MKTTIRQFLLNPRGLIIASVMFAMAVLAPNVLQASERWETLEAIHWVENPNNTERPGRYGELGAYQFRETTWRIYTAAPFTRAIDRRTSDAVAIRHYEWLKQGLLRNGVEVSPYTIALAWNGGLKAAVHGPCAATRDYAERVSNIAAQLHQLQAQVASNP